jgi:hypothetical protein
MSTDLFEDLSFFSEILKKSGYKSLAFGIAEIIDNAIDATASDIIILAESAAPNSNVIRLGFMDNGTGMSPDMLKKALKVGGRKIDQFRGRTGKFGFGLPGSSIANSDVVHVYSWTEENNGKCFKVTLDANNLNGGITGPDEVTLPTPYSDFLLEDLVLQNGSEEIGPLNFKKSGTLVLWDGCQRLNPKRPKNILDKQIKKTLARIFRHFISEDPFSRQNFKKCNMYWVHDLLSGVEPTVHRILPNDPLYLQKDHQHANEETPVIFDEQMDKSFNIGQSIVRVRTSLSSKNLRNAYKGPSHINEDLGFNQGISILREGREIDFGDFDFIIDRDQRHRFHGMEIHFDSGLDDFFGVPANKQHVVNLKKYDAEEGEFREDYNPLDTPVWFFLNDEFKIKDTLADYLKTIKTYGRKDLGSDPDDSSPDPNPDVPDVVDDEEEDDDSTSGGAIDEVDEVAYANCLEELNRLGYNNPSEADIRRFLTHKVVWESLPLGEGAGFMDVRIKHGCCILTINEDSVFYQKVLSEIYEIDSVEDHDVSRGIELMLLSYARCMDLSRSLEGDHARNFRRVLTKWSQKTEELLQNYYNE